MSSLVLVEQGRLDIPAVAAVLRECVDDLRLVIDSLEPIGHDLVTLLATLRYRLGRRLESAGLVLEWHVDDLPQLPWLDPTAALQVLRIVQEALTNVLKHSRAHTVRIEMRKEDDRVEVNIIDDGEGFDVPAMLERGEGGRGLRNLRKRAQGLGGDVSFVSQPGRTRVTLLLPLHRP
jgi:signal transduction histidine kinase